MPIMTASVRLYCISSIEDYSISAHSLFRVHSNAFPSAFITSLGCTFFSELLASHLKIVGNYLLVARCYGSIVGYSLVGKDPGVFAIFKSLGLVSSLQCLCFSLFNNPFRFFSHSVYYLLFSNLVSFINEHQ